MSSLGDVSLTLGLNTSPATQSLKAYYEKLSQGAKTAAKSQRPVGAELERLVKSANKLGIAYNKATKSFKDNKGAILSIQEVQKRVSKLNSELTKTKGAANKALSGIAAGFKNVIQGIPQGIGLAIGQQILAPLNNFGSVVSSSLKSAVGGFVEIDKSIRQVISITGESSKRFDSLSKSMNELAAATKFTAGELAEASVQLARAGFSADEIEQALPGIAEGAAATGEDISAMGNTIIQVLGGFQKDTSETAAVVDTLTAAANNSNTTVTELGEGLKYVAPVAKSLGLEFNDVAAAAGLLANSGIKASQMGTALRTGLGRLASATAGSDSQFASLARGTGRMSKAMQKLALDLKGTDGGLKSLPETIKALKGSFDQLGSTEKALAAKILFGDEAGSSWISLLNQSTEEIERFVQITNNASGTAAETSRKNLEGIAGKLDLLKSAFDSASASVGKFISAGLKPIVEAVTVVLNAFNSLPESIQFTIVGIVALTAALGAAAVAWAVFNAAAQAGMFTNIAGSIASAVTQVGLLATQLGGQFKTALGVAMTNAGRMNEAIRAVDFGSWSKIGKSAIKGMSSAFKRLAAKAAVAVTAIRGLSLASMWSSIKNVAINSLDAISSGAKKLGTGFAAAGKNIRTFAKNARPLGVTALAVGAVALAVQTYMAVQQEANEITKIGSEIQKDFNDSMGELGIGIKTTNDRWEESVKRVGHVQAYMDKFRNSIGLATAESVELQRGTVALYKAFGTIGDGVDKAIRKYKELSNKLGGLDRDSAEYEQTLADLKKIEGQVADTIAKSNKALIAQRDKLLAVKNAGLELTRDEEERLDAINRSIHGFTLQKDTLGLYKDAMNEATGASKNMGEGIKTTVELLKEAADNLNEAKENFSSFTKAMGQSFGELKKQLGEGLKTQTDSIKDELKSLADKNNVFAETKDDEIAAAREQAAGIKSAIKETTEALSTRQAKIKENLQSETQAIQETRDAASSRHEADVSGANRAHANAMSNFSRQLAAIDKQKAAVSTRYDAAIQGLAALTPAEKKLAAIERQRLEAQARQGGEEGLRARAQLERAARDERVASLQAAKAREIEALEEKAEKKRESQRRRAENHQRRISRLKEEAAAKEEQLAQKASELTEQAAAREKEIQTEMDGIKKAESEALKENAGVVKGLEEEKAAMAEATAEKRIALETKLDEVRQGHEKRLAAAEADYSNTRLEMLSKYNEAIGKSSEIIVRSGDSAWSQYASNALAQIEKVRKAAANAAGTKGGAPTDPGPTRGLFFAGGPVSGGSTYTVNEIGQEAFLSSSGRLSMINAPAFGHWKAPGAGTVIPAHITKNLGVPRSGSVNVNRSNISGSGGSVASSAGSSSLAQLAAVFGKVGRGDNITNNVTIQSDNTTQAASDMMVELTKIKRRRFNR